MDDRRLLSSSSPRARSQGVLAALGLLVASSFLCLRARSKTIPQGGVALGAISSDDAKSGVTVVAGAAAGSLVLLRNAAKQTTPRFVVVARSSSDVEEAVRYARRERLRVTVLATGHDYDGRSCGADTLNINTHQMRWARFVGPDLMSVGPGTPWMDVIEAALEAGMAPVAGYDASVGVSGFTLGGGHGPLSRQHGLGADHLVAATVVGADGIARAADDRLLRALRGGGGGTFGIVTELVIRVVPAPKQVTQLGFKNAPVDEAFMDRFFHNATWWKLLPPAWAGWKNLWCKDGVPRATGVYLYTGDDPNPLDLESMRDLYPALKDYARVDAFPSLLHFAKHLGSSPLGSHARQSIANVFVETIHPNLTDLVLKAACDATEDLTIFYNDVLGGDVIKNPPYPSAVATGFRDALFEVGANVFWTNPRDDAANVQASYEANKPLVDIAPASYLNEWTSHPRHLRVDDWFSRFYGGKENYDALLRVKTEIDPCNMFWVRHGVGSDQPSFFDRC
ncbi:hypothetical protein CTAYLR_005832 [Chrysophaeum taylorii]|uniref:FAD-binding PCMH-type domain-containing protein n=1 Tax=Chrysophaeum taylorii TaxID=2483200 RepID=A0AAD7XUJ9_9STRA|nr:hypothetical protein CTAYLR_005832 [Chrysophaeum taylorii]